MPPLLGRADTKPQASHRRVNDVEASLVTSDFFPGMRVRLPARPDWGTGQVQSVAGDRITVNFEHAGKVTLRLSAAALEPVEDDRA